MSVMIHGKERRIGLALSGGGFRAAAFHLGVFRKLDDLGLLAKIDLMSCVSGGSIAGGFLAANWGRSDTLDRLENYLRTRSIAVSSVLAGIFDPFASRLDKLADSYDDHLFDKGKLGALRSGPRVYFNATNLATGNMFSFVAGGDKPTEMGDWELGFVPADDFLISRAVAASSAFPPVFPPLRLSRKEYPETDVDYVTLADGGIYDNLGANPLFRRKRNNLDFAIVSDAGKPFKIEHRPTESGTIVLTEAVGILMEQVRGLQFKHLQLTGGLEPDFKPLWFSIDSREGEAQPGDTDFASMIDTNLKKLSKHELEVLTRHGGALLESRLKKYTPEVLGG